MIFLQNQQDKHNGVMLDWQWIFRFLSRSEHEAAEIFQRSVTLCFSGKKNSI